MIQILFIDCFIGRATSYRSPYRRGRVRVRVRRRSGL
jgi:hypothetical protein